MNTCKTCTKCGIEKPLTEFGKESRQKDGYRHQCKSCFNETRRIWLQKNNEALNAHRRSKYRNDETFREKKLRSDKEYRSRGRRRELYQDNRKKEIERNRKYKERNKDKVQKKAMEYREKKRGYLRQMDNSRRANLHPTYVKYLLKKSGYTKDDVQKAPVLIAVKQIEVINRRLNTKNK